MTPSDADLVQQALAGSQAAYHSLVERYATPAVNLATRMVRDRALAEDLAQEAFMRAFQHLESYDPQYRFAGWFFRILHNITIDHLRRNRAITVSLDGFEDFDDRGFAVSPPAQQPDVLAEKSAMAKALDSALNQVRPEYREVVVLRYREELAVQEIAEIMKLPLGTVKTYLFRARKELATILSAQGWASAPSEEYETSREQIP